MEQTMVNFFQSQGPWALLFVVLFYWTLRDKQKREEVSKQREDKLMAHNEGYQKILAELTAGQQQLTAAVTEMRQELKNLKNAS